MEVLCFTAGMLFFYTQNIYLFLCLLATILFRAKVTIVLAFMIALIWGALHDNLTNAKVFPDTFDGKTLFLKGSVISIPIAKEAKTQFIFKPIDTGAILVNCYSNCDGIETNQYINAEIKLRKPRNFLNPGGFDYVKYLKTRHISWLGSTKKINILSNDNSAKNFITIIREKLQLRLENLKFDPKTLSIIQALTIGISTNIAESDWGLFRRTGTIHLLVISGAHIGFVSGLMFLLANYLWSRVPYLCKLLPSITFASFCAIFVALFYSMLAGFTVSVQRALIACVFLFTRNFLQVKFTSWQAWRFALFSCLLIEPHYVLLPGFFLSFIAVAILFIASRYFQKSKFIKIVVLQVACLIGLMPFTLYWFSFASINGFFANLIAIPLVGFVIVPLSLLCLFCSFSPLSILTSKVINLLFWYLNYIDKCLNINIDKHLSIYSALCLVLATLLGLLYSIKSLRFAFFGLLFVLILPKENKIKFNEAQIDVLDVGQGLAVLIRTAKHTILYDTGGKFYRGKDLGELVIVPYLKTIGVNHLDMIIISHPDLDHRGGLYTIEKSYPVRKLLVNNPKYYNRGQNCHKFPVWHWDGISFKFLPITNNLSKKNNDSCVLQVKSQTASVLLSGDIESLTEKYLVANNSMDLPSDYLIVPHHGSKTSSSLEFLKMVNPKYGIFSYGYKNRYKFPHKEVLTRYNNFNIKIFNTAEQGMIRIKLR